MADQIEVPKLLATVALGPASDEIAVPKLTVLLILEPGESDDTSNRQGHVHTQIIVRSA